MFNWCELGSTFFDTFVLSRFKINILMFSWYSATSARWSSAGWLLDLLQVDLLASGASLVWPRSGRPRATKSSRADEGLFWKSSWLLLDGYSLYWRYFAIPPHGYHPHVLPLLGLHDEPLHHHQALNRPNSLPQGEGWGRLILASENPGNKNSNQSLLTLNKQITANDNFIFATLRLHGSRWLSKCIVGLFWGTNLPPCWKFVPQNSPTMHLTTILTQSSAQPQSGQYTCSITAIISVT